MDVVNYFTNKRIFLTGATGFLGKLIIEKILRYLPVDVIYILIRPQKEPAKMRLDQMLSSPVFLPLKKSSVNFDNLTKKLIVIEGDLRQKGLGISTNDFNLILNANIIIHCAAMVDFNSPLEAAVQTNVLGTEELLRLSKKMRQLESFLFVSTAYIDDDLKKGAKSLLQKSAPTSSKIRKRDEIIQPLKIDPYRIVHMTKMEGSFVGEKTTKIFNNYANVHSFTKHLAENIVALSRDSTPLIILRPTQIGATYLEPFPGWVESLCPTGSLFMYTGLGVTKFIPGDPNRILDIIPADFVVNQILSTIAYVGFNLTTNKIKPLTPIICHSATSSSNPLRWGFATQTMVSYWLRNPPRKSTGGTPSLYMVPNYPYFRKQFLFKYEIPLSIYSSVSRNFQSTFHEYQAKKTKTLVDRAHALYKSLIHLLENEWIFYTATSGPILNSLQSTDASKDNLNFSFDAKRIDWYYYINYFCFGIQRFILKEQIPIPKKKELEFSRNTGCDVLASNDDMIFPDLRFALFQSYNVVSPNSTKESQRKIHQTVLNSPKVRKTIQDLSKIDNLSIESLKEEAENILNRMEARMNLVMVRTLGYVFPKIWKKLYRQINVNHAGLEALKQLTAKKSIVYMPSHRSYIDFLILTYVLFAYDLPLPHIAAGEDFLGINFVHLLLRAGGAFFLKRSFKGDLLYSSIFSEYVQQLICAGAPVEFFIEGTRSRSGKSLQPKLGMLNIVAETFYENRLEDICFVPIHVNYERLVEGEMYPTELSGRPKQRESLEGLIKARSILQEDYGRIALKIGQPISLKEFTAIQISSLGNIDPFRNQQDRKDVISKLGDKIVHEITELSVWSAISLVSSLVLSDRHGIPREELIEHIDWLVSDIVYRNRGSYEWLLEQNPTALLDRGLGMLHAVTFQRRGLIFPDSDIESALCLSIYKNRLLHIFFQDAAVCVSVTTSPTFHSSGTTIEYIAEQAKFLHHLLAQEVVFKERPKDEEDFPSQLNQLVARGILTYTSDKTFKVAEPSKICSKPYQIFKYYCSYIWSFIESYFIVLLMLYQVQPNGTPFFALMERSLWLIKNLATQGTCPTPESCSKETLENAINYYLRIGVIERRDQLVYMSSTHKGKGQPLTGLIFKINNLRQTAERDQIKLTEKELLSQFPVLSKL